MNVDRCVKTMARERYVNKEELPTKHQQYLESVAENELPEEYQYLDSEELNINRMTIHSPELMGIFQDFVVGVWNNAGFSEYKRELTSLTVIREFGVEYEWNQHVRVALTEGLSPEEIRNISNREYEQFARDEEALLEYVDAYASQDVDDAIHSALSDYFDEATIIGIAMVANIYVMTCHFAQAFDLDLEVPFVGWELENL